MGIFGGVEKTKRAGNDRLPNFKDGTYRIRIDTNKSFVSTNPKSKGQGVFVMECTILDVLEEEPGVSNRAGSKVSWLQMLTRGRDDELDDKGERAMSRLKQYAGALYADPETGIEADDATITEEALEVMTGADKDNNILPGEAFKGAELIVRVVPMVNRKTGDRYVTRGGVPMCNEFFQALAPSAE